MSMFLAPPPPHFNVRVYDFLNFLSLCYCFYFFVELLVFFIFFYGGGGVIKLFCGFVLLSFFLISFDLFVDLRNFLAQR